MKTFFDTASNVAEGLVPIVLDAAVKSVVVLAAAGIVALCLRRASAASRHLVWFLAVASLLLLPVLSLVLPDWHILPHWMGKGRTSATWKNVERFVEAMPLSESEDIQFTRGSQASRPTEPLFSLPAADTSQPLASSSTVSQPTNVRRFDRASWGLFAWLSGTLLALIPTVLGGLSLWRLGRCSRRITESNWLELLRRLVACLSVKRTVALLKSSRRRIPMTWGFLHPKLLLPDEAEDWAEERRRVVLLHELAHIKRRDYLTNLITRIVCALYWFNPLVWVAARGIVTERERACDDLVLSQGAKPADYADQILKIAAGLPANGFAAFGAVAMARPSKLEGRLLAILDGHRNRRAVTRCVVLISVILIMAVVFPLAMMRAAESAMVVTHEVQLWVDPSSPVPRSTIYTLGGRYYDDLDSFLWNLRESVEPSVSSIGAQAKRWLRDLATTKSAHHVRVHVNPPEENARKAVNELIARCRKLGAIDHVEVRHDLAEVPVAFGKIREVELEDFDANRGNALLDFDSGTVVKPPIGEGMDSTKLAEWAGKTGVDVIARRVGESVQLIGLDMTLVQAETNAWDTIDPRRLTQSPSLLRHGGRVGLRPGQSMGGMSIDFSHGILFRTREDGLGIAQLVPRADAANAVKVRYKILEARDHDAVAKSDSSSAGLRRANAPAESPSDQNAAAGTVKVASDKPSNTGGLPQNRSSSQNPFPGGPHFRVRLADEGGLDLDTGQTKRPWQDSHGTFLGPAGMDVAWDDDQGGIFHRTLEDDSVKLLVLADARDFADAAAKARERFRLLQKSLEGMSPAKQCRFFAVLTDRRNLAVIEVTEFSEKECIITWSLARIQFREGAIQVEPYQQLPTGSDLASDPFGQRSTAQIEDNPRAAAADALSEANAVRLRMAEADFARASKLYESKLISESEYNKARRAVELRRAELGNDPAEVGRLKLQQAEEDLERTTRLHAQKLVGEQALDDARNAVELLQAELKGDVVELSRARLRHAEGEWQRLSELRKLNLCSEAELDQARLTVDVARADLESASVGRNRSAEDPNGGQASKSAATRSFVRLVVDESQLTFEGKETRWEQLPELLEKVPNRASTVLELAIDSDRLTIAQLNDAQARAGILSRRAGFEYLSYVGVQPLGSKGSPSSPRQTGNLATLLRDLSSAKVDAKRSPEMLAQQLVQGATNENEALQHLLLQSVSKPQKALIDTGPREAVQRWLELVKAGKSAESWQWIVPKSKSVLGPEEILRLNNRAQIEPRRSLGSDEAAMVVTSRFKDNSDRERVAYFYLRRQGGRWLINESELASPEDAQRHVQGFAAHPVVKFDVRREDFFGTWIGGGFLIPVLHTFDADGSYTSRFRNEQGAESVHKGTWEFDQRTASLIRRWDRSLEIMGSVIQLAEDFFQLGSGDGRRTGFHRHKEPGANQNPL